jgi:hypothetical protein
MICAVCRDALNRLADDRGVNWIHSLASQDDHLVVPIVPDDNWRNGKCDFCTGKPTLFVLPAHDFQVPRLDNVTSEGGWGACAICADLIAHDDWDELLTHAAATLVAKIGCTAEMFYDSMGLLYMALRENVTGPLVALP